MNKRAINRLPQLMIGLFLCGMGLGFTIEANLGLNPWDVFHDGCLLYTSPSPRDPH